MLGRYSPVAWVGSMQWSVPVPTNSGLLGDAVDRAALHLRGDSALRRSFPFPPASRRTGHSL